MMDVLSIDLIPDLATSIIVLGFSLGYLFGEGGSNFDWEVKYGAGKEWYDKQNPVTKLLIDKGLNVTHHFQYGLVAVIIGHVWLTGELKVAAQYFGAGMIVSDWKDFKYILKRLGIGTTYEPPVETTPPPPVVTPPVTPPA